MAKAYEANLRLGDIGCLFTKPDISPLSDDYQEYSYTSGIEFIADELYANPSYTSVRATLQLPEDSIEPGLEDQVRCGVERYCRGRLRTIDHDIHAVRWRGARALLFGFLALFLFIGLSRLVSSDEGLVLQILSEGLSIAGWVALWFPLELLVFKVWEHRLDRKVYLLLLDMDLVIQPQD